MRIGQVTLGNKLSGHVSINKSDRAVGSALISTNAVHGLSAIFYGSRDSNLIKLYMRTECSVRGVGGSRGNMKAEDDES